MVWYRSVYDVGVYGVDILKFIFGEGRKFFFLKLFYVICDVVVVVVCDCFNVLIVDFFVGSGIMFNVVNLLNVIDGG